ncbi:hypothetical protein M8J75_009773 [Diaphorina citri]|nr:hypothetical protein M8J75_009773 [Diaphorina citri]
MNFNNSQPGLESHGLPSCFASTKHSYKKKPKNFSEEALNHFNKKYQLSNASSSYKLSDGETWFSQTKWQLENFQALKEKLNDVKSNLNHFHLKTWHQHTNFVNRSSKVVQSVKRFIKPQLATQAWCKFHEIVHSYNVVPQQENSFTSIHLCEAPGAFITSLNHYLKLHHPRMQWDWIANTLNPHYEGNSFDEMISDDRLILGTHRKWYFGPDNTGNILVQNFVSHFKQHVQKNIHSHCFLVTADGSFDCQGNPGEQEILVGKLHYREVQIALSLLHNGGNLVIKIFTIFESDTICLMYLLACLFTRVDLFKPATSKEGNSEIYVICCDFHREVCEDLNVCSNLSKAFDPEYVDRVLAPLEDIPEQFLDKLYQGVLMFTNWQMGAIERNLTLFEKNIKCDPAECAKLDNLQVQIAELYMERYKLKPIHESLLLMPNNKQSLKQILTFDGRIENGAYKERLAKENLTLSQYVLEELLLIEPHCNEKPEFRCMEFKDLKFTKYEDHIRLVKGNTINTVNSSIFCLARLFKLLYEIRRVRRKENDLKVFTPCQQRMEQRKQLVLSRLESNKISTDNTLVLDFTHAYDLSCTDATSAQLNLLESLLQALTTLSDQHSILLINVPLLTQLSSSVILLLIGSLFEKIGFLLIHDTSLAPHCTHAILLTHLMSRDTTHVSNVVDECRKTFASSNKEQLFIIHISVEMSAVHSHTLPQNYDIDNKTPKPSSLRTTRRSLSVSDNHRNGPMYRTFSDDQKAFVDSGTFHPGAHFHESLPQMCSLHHYPLYCDTRWCQEYDAKMTTMYPRVCPRAMFDYRQYHSSYLDDSCSEEDQVIPPPPCLCDRYPTYKQMKQFLSHDSWGSASR